MALAVKSKPKTSLHHRKRSGQHQRHSKHFTKTYWPYLPMLLIVGLSLLLNFAWSQRTAVLGLSTGLTASNLLDDTNTARLDRGGGVLHLDTQLSAAATAKARDMASRDYWSHMTPDGRSPWSFIDANGYQYAVAGENLAYGFSDAQSAINAWLHSPEHRANLLNASYTDVGFGVLHIAHYQGARDVTLIVALYARPSLSHPAGFVAASNQPLNNQFATASGAVSRLQLFTSASSGLAVGLLLLATAAALYLLIRHGRGWHRTLIYSEAFIIQHPLLDIALVALLAGCFVLSRTAGFIG